MKKKFLAKIPTHIRITAATTYRVLWAIDFAKKDNRHGECDFEAKTITLNTHSSVTKAYCTLIHEVLHAIAHEYGVLIPHGLIDELEMPVLKILKLNGWLK